MTDTERQREHFESISARYYESRQHRNHLLLKHLIWEYFFGHAPLDPASFEKSLRVIEPMCGYGEGRTIIRRHLTEDFTYAGFDYSQKLVDIVREKEPGLDVTHADVTTYRLAPDEQKYDLMILIGGLHHVYSRAPAVVAGLADLLKAGGYFINFEPTQNLALLKKIRDAIYNRNELFDEDTEQAFDLSELNGIYRQGGFRIAHQVYPGLLSYVLYYNPDAFPLLNIGGRRFVGAAFGLDKLFMSNWFGRKFSFATLTLLRKD